MRTLILAVLALSACAAPVDARVGSFNFTLSGTDKETAPQMQTTMPTGTGTLAITHGVIETNYDITVAQSSTNPCSLIGTANDKDDTTIDIAANQSCTFAFSGGNVTATFSSASAKITDQTMALNVAYSFAGTTLGINFAGTGSRTYQGPRF